MRLKPYLACLAVLLSINTANADLFQYIYIEANEGSSSGGHVAVQFSDEVFHYQYQNGLIRLFKQDADSFHFEYRMLQNRPLHIADIEVSASTFSLLQEHFKLRFWQQDRQFKQFSALQKDGHLLEWLLQSNNARTSPLPLPDNSLTLPGTGLFFNDSDFDPGSKSKAGTCEATQSSRSILTMLRSQIESAHSNAFLAQRRTEISKAITNLPSASTRDYPLSARYSDLLTGLLALRVLQEVRPLTSDACHRLTKEERLNRRQIACLKAIQNHLFENAQHLVISKRPDWGYALLVTLARLIALEQSIQSGHWVFLDDFSEDSTMVMADDMLRFSDEISVQRDRAKIAWQQLAKALENSELDEQNYSRLEMAANRYQEWQAVDGILPLRYHGEQALPVKAIHIPPIALPALSSQQLEQALHQQKLDSLAATQQLDTSYAYHLLTRNCVTEIFRSINDALGRETQERLGGVIDESRNIIPFTAFAMVSDTYSVKHITTLPSYRQQQLAKQYAEEFAPLVYARESNILSASFYHYQPDDALFIFFTDDALLLRPVFGAINSLAGLGQSFWGLFTLPFDDGLLLTNGLRGVLMSLPELGFVNVRKGSYKYLPPPAESRNNLTDQ